MPDRISEIQAALAREGYYQGEPNGKLDVNTVAALEKFQSSNDLEATGKLDAPTLQKLGLGSDIAGVAAPRPVVPNCCSKTPTSGAASAGTAASSGLPSTSQLEPKSSMPGADHAADNPATGAISSDPKPAQK